MDIKLKVFTLFFAGVFVFTSCQKVIDVEVEDADENIVIDASYNANNETVKVKITRSLPLFGGFDFEPVNGAVIQITTPDNNVHVLSELGDGVYEYENLAPIFNDNYVMNASIEGLDYEATAFLPNVIPLDSLSQEFIEASLFGDEGYVVFMNLTDPGGENYYRAVREVNGDTLSELEDQFLFDNTFTQGNSQTVPFFGSRYEIGDTVIVRLQTYNEAAYQYYSDLLSLAGDNGQSAAPANPRSNWNNEALGIFNAYGYDEKTIIIEE